MMIEHIGREREIRRALHAIARQRVAMVLQPGNVLVVEKAAPDAEWFDVAARTCLIRGWVEVLHDALPTGKLSFQGSEPVFPSAMPARHMYRLTEGGWAAINRSHAWVVSTFGVALVTLIASVAALYVAAKANPSFESAATGKSTSAAQLQR